MELSLLANINSNLVILNDILVVRDRALPIFIGTILVQRLIERCAMLKDKSQAALTSSVALETTPIEQSTDFGSTGRLLPQGDIGFVGLGRMGTAMAANLAAAGHQVIAYVRRPEQMDKLAALGLKPTTDITRLFDCEVVISMLPDDNAVRDVVFGREDLGIEGLASGLKRGAIHLSMSTISTSTASDLSQEHARHGQGYVAAPVLRKSRCRQGAPALHCRRRCRQPMSNVVSRYSTLSGKRHL